MHKFLAVFLTLALGVPAHAAIVDHGTYFQDTASGQYWLKLTETNGRSYNDVSDNLDFQQEFEGWRYATLTELETLFSNFGIPAQGNACGVGTYCGTVDTAYADQIEDLIHLFGDLYDAYLDATGNVTDTAPDGAAKAVGMVGDPYIWASNQRLPVTTIQDREWVNRATGVPTRDWPDTIWTENGVSGQLVTTEGHFSGSFLVRDTDPTIPLPPPPPPNPDIAILFDNLAPEELGLALPWCGFYPCGYSDEGFGTSSWEDGAGGYVSGWFGLQLTSEFDAQARPWARVTGYDVRVFGTADISVYCADGTVLGDGWCRISLDDPFGYLPGNDSISNAYIDYSAFTFCIFCSWELDNVTLEFISNNIAVDYDPWSTANEISPKSTGFVTVQISTTSTAAGDDYDFDAADVDPASLRVGPNQAAPATAVLNGDYDNDGDTDYIFGFRTEQTGLTCLDRSIAISGRTYDGDPIVGHDVIVPVQCDEIVAIDVDPFNSANRVWPNDNYQITVGILGKTIASGDAVDFDATQVDPATLKFGPAESPNTASPIAGDLDGDSNTDLLVGFNSFDSGIACGDTELQVTGELYSGLPIVGSDAIETIDCETTSCHP